VRLVLNSGSCVYKANICVSRLL